VVGWEERAGKFTKRPVHHEREQRARAVVLFLPKDSIKLTYHVEEKEKKRKGKDVLSSSRFPRRKRSFEREEREEEDNT